MRRDRKRSVKAKIRISGFDLISHSVLARLKPFQQPRTRFGAVFSAKHALLFIFSLFSALYFCFKLSYNKINLFLMERQISVIKIDNSSSAHSGTEFYIEVKTSAWTRGDFYINICFSFYYQLSPQRNSGEKICIPRCQRPIDLPCTDQMGLSIPHLILS